MAFLAGEVTALLGAKVNPAGFAAFDAAISRSAASASKAEKASVAAGAAMDKTGKSAGTMGAAMRTGAVAGVAALGYGLVKSVGAAANFEQAMDRVKAVTKASGGEMKQMSDIARKLGKETGIGATAAAGALEALAKGGLTTSQIIGGGLAGALALAQAGGMEVAAAAEATANALNLFGLEGKEATHVADALAVAANDTTADVADFALALSQGGSAAKIAGLSFDETVVALESLAKIGVKGSDAGTSLKAALLQVIDPTDEAAATMKKLGVDFTDSTGKMKPLGDVAQMLKDKLSGLSKEQQVSALKTMAGTDGFRALTALMEQGGTGVDKLSDGLKQQGEAARVAKENTDNLDGAWKRFKATLQDIGVSVGTPALESLTKGLDKASEVLDGLSDNDGLKDFLTDVSDAGDALGDIAGKAKSVGEALNFSGAVGGLGDVFGGLVSGLKSALSGDLGGVWDGMVDSAFGAARAMLAPFAGLAKALPAPFKTAISSIMGLFTQLLGGVSSTFSALGGLPVVGDQFDAIGDAIDRARDDLDAFRDDLTKTPAPKVNIQGAIAALKKLDGTALEPKVMKILANGKPAESKVKALIALGIPPKTAKLLADASNLLAGVENAKGAISTLKGTTVMINAGGNAFAAVESLANKLARLRAGGRAQGRGPIGSEVALVGEGRNPREAVVDPRTGSVTITSGPSLMALSDSAYVIPEDPAYRGRAMGLLSMLATDLGLRGFKAGKPAKKRTSSRMSAGKGDFGKPVPNALVPTQLPLSSLEDRESKTRASLNDAKQKVHDLPGKIRDAEKRVKDISGRAAKTDATKAKKARDLAKAKDQVRSLRRSLKDNQHAEQTRRQAWKEAARMLAQGKKWQAKITSLETRADTEATRMANANKSGNAQAYETARKSRIGLLAELKAMVGAAANAYKGQAQLDAQKQFEEITGQLQDAQSDASSDEAYSVGDKARLSELDRDVALAALTSGLDDDRSAAVSRERFLTGLLTTAQSQNRSADVIRELAEAVGSARSNLSSLTGSGSNDNADLQAQIEQERSRREKAEAEARFNARALSVFGGPNDLGAGRGNTLIVNTLHPGSPQVASALAQAAFAGASYQAGVVSPRLSVG